MARRRVDVRVASSPRVEEATTALTAQSSATTHAKATTTPPNRRRRPRRRRRPADRPRPTASTVKTASTTARRPSWWMPTARRSMRSPTTRAPRRRAPAGCTGSGRRSWRRSPTGGTGIGCDEALGRSVRAGRLRRPPALHVRAGHGCVVRPRAKVVGGLWHVVAPSGDIISLSRTRLISDTGVESESAKSPAGSVHQSVSSSPAAASSRSTPSRPELGADLGAQLLARGELDVEVEDARCATVCARSARSRISIHSCVGVPHARRASNASGSKSASSSRFEHAQHVAVELGGHAGGVVVGGDEAVDVLHEVGAEQERVAGRERRARGRRGTVARGSGARLPMVLPRNATTPACRRRGVRSRWCSKSPTTACTATPRTRAAIAAAASRSVCSLTSNGTKRSSVPASRERVEQQPRLLRRARAELDERVGLGALGDVARVLDEDRALGAGGVVLGEPGDLVEQLAAAVVVEPLRRQRLRRGGEPGAHVGFERARAVASGSRWTSTVIVGGHAESLRASAVGSSTARPRARARATASGISRPVRARRRAARTRSPVRAREQRVADARAVHDRAVGEQQVEPAVVSRATSSHDGCERVAGCRPASRCSSTRAKSTSVSASPSSASRRAGLSAARSSSPTPSGNPCTKPLSENSQRPATNGALPVGVERGARRRQRAAARNAPLLDVRRATAKLGVVPHRRRVR